MSIIPTKFVRVEDLMIGDLLDLSGDSVADPNSDDMELESFPAEVLSMAPRTEHGVHLMSVELGVGPCAERTLDFARSHVVKM